MMSELLERLAALSPAKRELLLKKLAEQKAQTSTIAPAALARRAPGAGPSRLSYAQERLWFLEQLDPGTATYNVPAAVRLSGPLEPRSLERALNEVVRRHEALRTTFTLEGDAPVQVVAPSLHVPLAEVDLRTLPVAEREAEMRRLLDADAQRPFDLVRGPLFRATLLRLEDAEWVLMLCMHHIVSDGWSMGVLVRELAALYGAPEQELGSRLPELPLQYADFAHWQRERLSRELESHLDYWRRTLSGAPPVLQLPTDRPRPDVQSMRGDSYYAPFDPVLATALGTLSHREGVTLFMTLLAAFATVLHRYSRQDDIVVGSPIANRGQEEVEGLIGFFVNTLALRVDLSGDPSFLELLGRVRQRTTEAYAHQDAPYEKVVEAVQPERNLRHNPLFQVMFVLQNAPMPELAFSGLTLSPLDGATGTSRFDLLLSIEHPPGGELRAWFEYSSELFDRATIVRLSEHLRTLLEGVVADPSRRLSELPLATAAERQLPARWNETRREYPLEPGVHRLFEAQVARTPDAVALAFEGGQYTYRELNARANQLAWHLRRLGVRPERVVGICLERSPESLIAVLGVLKSGGAFVALDPAYPSERLAVMLEDARPMVVLTQERLVTELPPSDAHLVRLDVDAALLAAESVEDVPEGAHPENLAYLIYTSGSTGRPKGVAQPYRTLTNLVLWQVRETSLRGPVRTLQFAPLSFDISLQESFTSWCEGGVVVQIPEEVRRDSAALLEFLVRWRIERLHLPFVALQGLADALDAGGPVPTTLRDIIPAGEQLLLSRTVRSLLARIGQVGLHNHYGANETHVATAYTCEGPQDTWPMLPPVGRAIANNQMYVLDEHLRPVPVGVPGEIFLAGANLSRGYMGLPDQTASRFLPDPFSTVPGARMMRTGDLGRYLPDGNVQHMGRVDLQIKFRGFRVEPAEIELTLGQHPEVADSVVVLREDSPGDKRLVAYVVPVEGRSLSPAVLRTFVRERLPDYMVPSAFVLLDALPTTVGGKVYRPGLPPPDPSRDSGGEDFSAPATEVERLLAGIWSDVLKQERIGRDDSFFDLGGHSLLATQMTSRVREVFRVELHLRRLFETPTVAGLAVAIEELRQAQAGLKVPPLLPVGRDRTLPLSFAQQRLWFLDRLESGSAAYNLPAAIRLEGALDVPALERALNEVVRRHESLRTTFSAGGGQGVQVIWPSLSVALPVRDLESLPPAEREAESLRLAGEDARQPFDLQRGPMLRASLLRLAPESHVLLLTMHHIASDGWSVGVLVRELGALYAAFHSGEPSPLPALPIQYADFALWQREWLQGEALEAQLSWWKRHLEGAPVGLELPTDRPRPPVQTYRGRTLTVTLPPSLAESLRALSRREGVTLFMTLLAAFETLLMRYSGQADFVVGAQIANRNRQETEGLIGFFVNALALRADLTGDPTFRELLRRVREVTLGAHAHQDLPFERLVQALNLPRDLTRPPLFQVAFVLQNAPVSLEPAAGLRLLPVEVENTFAKLDLELSVVEAPEGLVCAFEYSSDLFESRTIERLAAHLQALLEGVVVGPSLRLSELPLWRPEERARALAEWNRVPLDWKAAGLEGRLGGCFHERFEEQAAATPDAVAVCFRERSRTYAELNARANQMAHALRARGLGEEAVVGLLLDRGIEFLVGMLGVFKAGGAYVPLEPGLPAARLQGMVQQARCPVVLSDEAHHAHARSLFPESVAVLRVDSLLEEGGPTSNPVHRTSARSLAYVFFTSGSTGTPKGAMVDHGGMLNHLDAKVHDLRLTAADVVVQNASASFDISVWQFLCALRVGGRVRVVDADTATDPWRLLQVVESDGVTVLEIVPSLMASMLEGLGEPRPSLASLRWLVVTGEALPPELCRQWLRLYSRIPIVNAYGPTECSDDVAHHTVRTPPAEWVSRMPIGRPVPNLRLYVLDGRLEPVPTGVAAELYVGGAGVGRGYLGDTARTAASFLPDPFSEEPGARLYRTGDLARFLADGTLEFLGRIDHQVKVRGYRIELGEIEAALSTIPGVTLAVVMAREDRPGQKRLVGYVAPERDSGLDAAELRRALQEKLPDYMVPAAFVLLESFPLLPSGKVDRRALPAPREAEVLSTGAAYVAPRTRVEQVLAELWAELLEVERVGVNDGFFERGGHSLIAIHMVSRIRRALGVEVPLRAVFEEPTLGALAARIEGSLSVGLDALASQRSRPAAVPGAELKRLPPRDTYPLASIQLPEWYFHELEPENPFYNITLDVLLTGDLDAAALVSAFQELVERHAALRIAFGYEDGKPVQRVLPRVEVSLEKVYRDCRHVPEAEQPEAMRRLITEASRHVFDFTRGPLFRLDLAEFSGQRFLMVFVVHHILWDETSSINLSRELSEVYNARRARREPRLAPLALEYVDWAQWLEESIASGRLEDERRYWLRKFSTLPPALELPTDRPRPVLQTFRGDTIFGAIPGSLNARLEAFLKQNNVTLYIFLLAVLDLQLHRLSGQSDFVVGTPIVNRDDEALEPLMGLFATAMPMRCTVSAGMSFRELLGSARETALEAYEHHRYPSVLAIQELAPEMDLSRSRLFSVMYGTQNNKTRLMATLRFDGAEMSFVPDMRHAEDGSARFDLTVIVDQTGEETSVRFNYNSDLFDATTAERMHRQFLSLVEQTLDDADRRLGEYGVLAPEEARAVLAAGSGPRVPFAQDEGVHRAIEAQAARTPEAVALALAGGGTWSYRALNEAANRWAHHLLALGVKPEERVGLLFEPSAEMVVAILAVLKAGAAYVPIHPEYPPERQAQVVSASGVRVVLTHGALSPSVAGWVGRVLRLDADAASVAHLPASNPERPVHGDMLAYTLFTSGTTGTPKGIDIEHRGLVNLLACTQREYGLGAQDAVLFLTPFNFDASILDVFWPLATGARMVIPQAEQTKDVVAIGRLVRDFQVTLLQCVPLMLGALVDAARGGLLPALPSLRQVICGGAFLGRELRDAFRATFSCRLANHYGPTEVTVDATRFDCAREVSADIVPIGRPLSNVRVYVLDASLRPVPSGVVGEVYVASPGLARGYLGDAALTAARFVPDPFSPEPGARMYRTGDLGRLSADGDVHFVGRVDKQVKVRGNRVELEEVESRLASHPAIARCAVQHRRAQDGGDTLLACVELREPLTQVVVDGEVYRLFTVAQRPELRPAMELVHLDAWPDYFSGDRVLRTYWPRLWSEFPRYQWALLGPGDEVIAVGNSVPVYWDGTPEGLPAGWDASLEQAFHEAERGMRPNTLLILAGAVARKAAGRGLSVPSLNAFRTLARGLGMERCLVPARPTGKAEHPEVGFAEWCERRRPDGQLEDAWLRAHERVGGRLLKCALKSQHIVATLAEWETWTGRRFTESGAYVLPKAMQEVRIDVEAGVGEYYDPSVWMEHTLAEPGWLHVDAEVLRQDLRAFLPEYMIPEHFRLLTRLPLTDSGKVDEAVLRAMPLGPGAERRVVPPRGAVQETLASLWRLVLGLEEVGVTDDFFELGGHSLGAVQLLARIQSEFQVSLRLRDLYKDRTILGLERLIQAAQGTVQVG